MWKVLSGLFLGWSLGANDSANVFGTGVATGVVKYRTAILLTAVCVVLGAYFEGAKCIDTIGELSRLNAQAAFWCGLAAAITMTALTCLALPASSSQAIIGAVLGAGMVSGTADFSKLYKIVICWVLTPVGGIVIAYFLYRVLAAIFDRTIKSLTLRNLVYTLGILVAGCYAAYTLGGNNVANVTGIYVGSGLLTTEAALLLGGFSIAAGVLTYSKKVMMTIGRGIVPLDPFSALVSVLDEAVTLHIFTQIGVPVSSSQAVVGAVVGVGYAGSMKTVSTQMLAKIGFRWILTPAAAGLFSYFFLHISGFF